MTLDPNFLLILFAGIINGSFIVPERFMLKVSGETAWLVHTIFGLMILPWILLFIMMPHSLRTYATLPASSMMMMLGAGLIFGVGQTCFSYAFRFVGIAISFMINLSISVIIGSMFVIYYKGSFFTHQGYITIIAVVFIIIGLIIHYFSNTSSSQQTTRHSYAKYQMGWILASIAGLSSGFQNVAFFMTAYNNANLFVHNNGFWFWPPFFLAASIPMNISFISRNKNISDIKEFLSIRNGILTFLMSLFFIGSLALYSIGVSRLSNSQLIIAWPTLMVAIIMTTQLWGVFFNENVHNSKRDIGLKLFSLALLIASILLLARVQ